MRDSWPNKKPEAEEIFGFEWDDELGADEKIVASTFDIITGDNNLVISSQAIAIDGKATSCKVAGGTPDMYYLIRNHITTDSAPARKPTRDARLHIR